MPKAAFPSHTFRLLPEKRRHRSGVSFTYRFFTQSPMGAPHWGQNLLSEAAPQMGQAFSGRKPRLDLGAIVLAGLLASSSAILALEAVTASTSSRTASGISPSYSLTNHSPMVR